MFALLLLPLFQAPAELPPLDRVLLVSVDGLRSDALVAGGPEGLPHFHRVMAWGGTLNARTDPDATLTLPNHVGMLTGLFQDGPGGHAWAENLDPLPGVTLHDRAGRYVPGVFDVAHDHGLRTALFAGKTKFSLFDVSWNEVHGAPDDTAPDHGRDKIDEIQLSEDAGLLTARALAAVRAAPRSLVLLHLRQPDDAGHAGGWDLSPGSAYLGAVGQVDALLGRILADLERQAARGIHVGLVLTADHGGGYPLRGHSGNLDMWMNSVIPLGVWAAGKGPGDLYRAFPQRWTMPGLEAPGREGRQPLRNLDAGRIALELLRLPWPPVAPRTGAGTPRD